MHFSRLLSAALALLFLCPVARAQVNDLDGRKYIDSTVSQGTSNGAFQNVKSASASVTCSGATSSATDLIPAGSLVLGVTVRVTTAVTGSTTFTIGDGTDADKWGATIAQTAGTTTDATDFTTSSPTYYTSATSVVLTGTGGSFSAGVVRVTVHYIDFTSATS